MKPSEAEVRRRVERFQKAARDAGIRLTHQRLEIFRELASREDHPSAEAVFKAVRERMPTVSLDTVYRTLWFLEQMGVVSTLWPKREVARFDANMEPHHHYVCTCCGLVRDFESPKLDPVAVPEEALGFGSVDCSRIEILGVCNRCAEAKEPGPEKQDPAKTKTVNRKGEGK